MLKSVSYYAFEDKVASGLNTCSRASDEHPYMVNCAGFIRLTSPFTSHNTHGRPDYYLMYISEGHLHVDIEGTSVRAGAGDVILFPPKYKYRYSLTSGTISYYYTHFTGSHAARLLEQLGFEALPSLFHAGASEEAMQGFTDMFKAFARDDAFRDFSTAVALTQILVSLARATRAAKAPMPLERSFSYIKSFYAEDISIPDLAAMEGLSVSRYNVLFRETIGASPIQYITSLRIKQACALLKATNLHIKEIGESVGYRDNHFFSKAFKKKMGVSPQKYRDI